MIFLATNSSIRNRDFLKEAGNVGLPLVGSVLGVNQQIDSLSKESINFLRWSFDLWSPKVLTSVSGVSGVAGADVQSNLLS